MENTETLTEESPVNSRGRLRTDGWRYFVHEPGLGNLYPFWVHGLTYRVANS